MQKSYNVTQHNHNLLQKWLKETNAQQPIPNTNF